MDASFESWVGQLRRATLSDRLPMMTLANAMGGSLSIRQLDALFDLLGIHDGASLWAGWWQGFNEIQELSALLGEPVGIVKIPEGGQGISGHQDMLTDANWVVWQALPHMVISAASHFRQSPNVISPAEPRGDRWVVRTPPAELSSHLFVLDPLDT